MLLFRGVVKVGVLRERAGIFSNMSHRSRVYSCSLQHFWWPTLKQDVKEHIKSCAVCQTDKARNHKPQGKLRPLKIPDDRWSSISMDFITCLPLTEAKHATIMVFVDRLSKMTHLVATDLSVDAPRCARIFLEHIWRLHGMPKEIICDRDPRFRSAFLQSLAGMLGTQIKMSTAFHPQTDGQTERMNRVVEDCLRHYVMPHQGNWDQLLPVVEFAINSSWQLTCRHSNVAMAIRPRLLLQSISHLRGRRGCQRPSILQNRCKI